ncbi:MAG: penicillin-binding transpeptidase domain-containing protein, partial [Pseudomonadota bacterium]
AFKPFVYAAALDSERFTPATLVDDSPVVFDGWMPRNFDGEYRGPIRLREALANSVNAVAAKVANDIGIESVSVLATKMGISTPLENDLSLALGSSVVLPVDLASAYCGIANGGRRVAPRYVLQEGDIPAPEEEGEQVLRSEVAFLLTSMMQSVVSDGTARMALRLGRPAAGKTGTTNKQKDAWFAGFTPQMVAVVWVGFDAPRSLGSKETGARAALPIWLNFMRNALRGTPKRPFTQPPGVVVERIDPASGLLAGDDTLDAIEEFFVAGTEPKKRASAPDSINPDTILMGTDIP